MTYCIAQYLGSCSDKYFEVIGSSRKDGVFIDFIPCFVNYNRQAVSKNTSVNHNNLIQVTHSATNISPAVTAKMALLNVRSLSNKTFILNNFITSLDLDFLLLTEIWLTNEEHTLFHELCPLNYKYFSKPRLSGRSGGIAVVFKECFICSEQTVSAFSSFEDLHFNILGTEPILCCVIYCPPNFNSHFRNKFSEMLSDLVLSYEKMIIVGAFNFHVDKVNDYAAVEFLYITQYFNLVQHVSGSTHSHGHTLDLFFIFGLAPNNFIIEDSVISDHKSIVFNVQLA